MLYQALLGSWLAEGLSRRRELATAVEMNATLPFPACFAVSEAPAAPCPAQSPAVPLKTRRKEGRQEGRRRQTGVLDACPQNMILSSEVSSPVLQALYCIPPSLLPSIFHLFCPYSLPSLCTMEHCFLISVGIKGV
ncbi:hypothetical protein Q8A73_001186 [Channa argus]|nr:hypothetical protein Q8A73_001186 [Channa argus]